MKNLLYKISAILLVLTFSNCSDEFLELEPKLNRTEANAYSTEDDAMQAMVAVYSALAVQPWIHVPMQSDILSDDAFTAGEPGGGMGQYQEQEMSTVSPHNAAAMDLWNKCYSGIYRANVYLEKEGGITWLTEEKQLRMRAEVRVLRAHFYWDLVRHFGWVPLYEKNLENINDSKNPVQRTPDEILTFIANELLTAMADLPLVVGPDELGRVTKDVARMLIARIYQLHVGFFQPVLGAGAWVDGNGTNLDEAFVRTMVDEILGSGRYTLMTTYAEVFDWANDNNQESIFEWQIL